MNQEFFSVLVQVAAALGLAGMILLLSILMGKRSSVRKPADIPYECGMIFYRKRDSESQDGTQLFR